MPSINKIGDWKTYIAILVASPILLALFVIAGVFAVGKMLMIITNPVFILSIILLDILLWKSDNLTFPKAAIVGLLVGFVFWIIVMITFLASISWICTIPILGTLVCGAVSILSVFTDAIGYMLAGIIVSLMTASLLMLFRR
jgi:hypothetical protein